MNIQPLLWVDTFALAASLPAKSGLWKPGTPRLLPLRGPRKGTLPEEADYVWYQVSVKWVEARNMLSKIARGVSNTGPLDIGIARLEMLDPGARLDWTEEPVVPGWTTLRIALRVNPAVLLIYGIETIVPALGMINAVNPAAPHCAINAGETQAITLEVTVRPKLPIETEGAGDG